MFKHHHNLSLLWTEVLAENMDQAALCYPDRIIHYKELGSLVEKLGDLLLQHNLHRGNVIAIAHTKKPLSYALMLACLRLGAFMCEYRCRLTDETQDSTNLHALFFVH